jgi:hypothetical protein
VPDVGRLDGDLALHARQDGEVVVIVIDTPDAIEAFQKMRLYYALKIEVETGLKHSQGSILAHLQRVYGVKARTKAGALEEWGARLREEGVLKD